ncbi:MAG: sigma-70 family RNA polymerase sigma factor [Kiritimatiellae bacterium]|nr:sigma-70 family RNA polymerase sigma factor [Kiritimatiellia bacterium]
MSQAAEVTRRILEHQTMMLGYILGHTGDYHQAEDIFQEVCTTICEKYSGEIRNFKAWAMQITRYKILSYYGAKGRAPEMVHLTPELAETLADETVAFDTDDTFSDEKEALRKCLDKVTGKNRVMVLKRYGEGLSCSQIAKAVGWTVNAVYVALSRIRKSLEKCIRTELGTA